jgi:hypothetical protein
MLPDWLIRRSLAFVLGFAIMGMVTTCQMISTPSP